MFYIIKVSFFLVFGVENSKFSEKNETKFDWYFKKFLCYFSNFPYSMNIIQ